MHNEALQRLPVLASWAKFGSERTKSLPPPLISSLSRTSHLGASHEDVTVKTLKKGNGQNYLHALETSFTSILCKVTENSGLAANKDLVSEKMLVYPPVAAPCVKVPACVCVPEQMA